MTASAAHVVYLVLWVIELAVRVPHMRRNRANVVATKPVDPLDRGLLTTAIATGAFVPLVWLVTGFPALADYAFSPWAAVAGVVAAVGGAFFLWRSHTDLGLNWSATVQLREKHELVTRGVYARIRHPMYTGMILCRVAQALLLANWIIGPCGLVAVLALYLRRVRREEQMMTAAFGEDYRAHMARTHRLWPRVLG